MPAWAPNLTSFRSATVVAPAAGESVEADDRLVARVVRVAESDDRLGPLRRDRVLLQVEVEVLGAGLDRLVEGRAHPRHLVVGEAHLAGHGVGDGGLEALARTRAASSITYGGNAGSPVAIVSVPSVDRLAGGAAPPPRRRPAGAVPPVGAVGGCGRRRCRRRRRRRRRRVTSRPPTRSAAMAVRRMDLSRFMSVVHAEAHERTAVASRVCPRSQCDPTLTVRQLSSYCLTMTLAPRTRVLDAAKRAASGGGSTRSPSTTSPPRRGVSRATLYRHVPRRQGRAVRGAAGPRARGVLHRAARRRSRVPTRSRTCSCAPSSSPPASCAPTSTWR